MFRLSNCVFSTINILIMMFGLAGIAASVYLSLQGAASECHKVLQNPLLIIGVFLCVVAMLGLIGSCCKLTFVLWIYSFVTFLLVIGIIVFTVFAFVVTNKGAGKILSGIGYKEYKLGDYSNWLRNHFVNGENWDEIRSCLIDAHVCQSLGNNNDVNDKVADFFKKKLSPTQSGCCKPPAYCGFEYKNATFWLVPKSGPAVQDPDCTTWSNNQKQLCFDCNSCKGGVLANIRKDWRTLAIVNICILLFIIIIYFISCCTRRSIQSRPKYYKAYRP